MSVLMGFLLLRQERVSKTTIFKMLGSMEDMNLSTLNVVRSICEDLSSCISCFASTCSLLFISAQTCTSCESKLSVVHFTLQGGGEFCLFFLCCDNALVRASKVSPPVLYSKIPADFILVVYVRCFPSLALR